MKRLLSAFNLGDSYEIEARILPAAMAVLPVTVFVLSVEASHGRWLIAIGFGLGLEVFLAVVMSKVAHSLGRRLETRLEAEWKGLPTLRWLLPDDNTHSEQQKTKWRQALAILSGLDIKKVLKSGDMEEYAKVISDSVMTVRYEIRNYSESALLRKHNAAYGFARNAAGMRWLIVALCVSVLVGSIVAAVFSLGSYAIIWIAVLFSVIAVSYSLFALSHVKYCADRYAETFFATAARISEAQGCIF